MTEQKKIVRGFSLGDADMATIERVADEYEISASAALRRIIKAYRTPRVNPSRLDLERVRDFMRKYVALSDEAEQTVLEFVRDSLAGEYPRLVITGEPGTGKTRLLKVLAVILLHRLGTADGMWPIGMSETDYLERVFATKESPVAAVTLNVEWARGLVSNNVRVIEMPNRDELPAGISETLDKDQLIEDAQEMLGI